ncbi:MAG: phosphohistidine phosphatase SixA [Thermoanaerobaculia bacterium]
MRIHLLRHGEAEDRSSSGRDADRALTEAGAKRLRAIARGIASLGVEFSAIYVSPLLRARQTAEPVAAACGFAGGLTTTPALVPEAPLDAILDELALSAAGRSRTMLDVLLVGHQPHLGRLFGRLSTGRTDVEFPMRKATLAAFEIEGDPSLERAELRYFLPARILEKLA